MARNLRALQYARAPPPRDRPNVGETVILVQTRPMSQTQTRNNDQAILLRAAPRFAGLAAVIAAISLGLLSAHWIQTTAAHQRPDLALKLAALLCLPFPALMLHWLTTPPNSQTRRMLGETAHAQLHASLKTARRAVALGAIAPLAMGAASVQSPENSPDILRAALIMLASLGAVYGLGVTALLSAIRLVAQGPNAVAATLAGAGAFGPAEAAPLLYAPAFAWVAALVPAAVATAAWSADPALLSLGRSGMLVVATATLALFLATQAQRQLEPWLQAGMLAVESAHATPFAQSEILPKPPHWLTLWRDDKMLFFARSFARTQPTAPVATLALVMLGFLLLSDSPQALAVGAIAATVTLWSGLRALWQYEDLTVDTAAWLGASAFDAPLVRQKLAVALALPAAASVSLGLRGGHWLAAVVGLGVGLLLAATVVKITQPRHGIVAARLALAGYFATLVLAAAPA